ncbi:MAG: response regulator [Candidatus Omnitrophica bacterium]|nr:response regulator [Candidatus Omnitrophota bacterium]
MKKIKIAIVDDEIEFVNDLARGLEILGYGVSKAASGSHAIEVINREKPDVILCDYKLDDMDGTQVIAKTKSYNPEAVYIIVTAYFDGSFEDAFKKAGADGVIYKPIQLTEIDNTIQKALNNAKKR